MSGVANPGSTRFPRVLNRSQHNPFDLIKRDLVVATIVELGRAGALMRRHLLGIFEQPPIEQINRDPGCPEGMAAEPGDDPGLQGATDDHPPRVLAGHALAGQLLAATAAEGAE